jgi:zinc finger BED domain-containing protein 5/7/8/9
MGKELKETLNASIQAINFIKAHPKNSRIFATICEEMGSEHQSLLLHTEVRWLSRGKKLPS